MNRENTPYTPQVNKWLIAIAVMPGTFMELIDTTVVNVALPHIAGSLSAGVDESTWVLTSYLVSNAIMMPLAAWLGSALGRKRLLMLCLVVFTLSSMACGAAPTLESLIFFRVIQGAGGGALQPLSQAILFESFAVEERGMAMAVYGVGAIVAPIVGPLLGGWITDNLNWRWAFYINLPVGILALVTTAMFIFDPEFLRARKSGRMDFLGVGLLVVGIGALQIVLDKGERDDWFSSDFIVRLSLVALVALVALVYWELKTKRPFVDLRLFKDRNFASGVTVFFFFRFVLYGSMVLLPLFLQTLMGYDATLAGKVMAWGGVSAMVMMPMTGRLCNRVDNRWLSIAGLLIGAWATYLMSGFNVQIDYATAVWPRILQGLGIGVTFVALTNLTMGHISRERMGNATGIYNLLRNLGGSFGIAVVTTLLARRAQFHQSRLVEHLTAGSPAFSAWQHRMAEILPGLGPHWHYWEAPRAMAALYDQVQAQAMTLSYNDGYWFFTVLFLLLVPLVFMMRRPRIPQEEIIKGG
ncbi:MAG: DHA2 family efflux MFS transporter permease subunit [Desulfobaccales bacterium]